MGANAVTTVPVYTAGEVLTAADMNITNSGIPVFASSVERDAAFGGTGEKTLAEGQYAYLESTNQTLVYDGSSWISVGVAPALVFIKSQTIGTTVASVTVTDAFSATYDNYKILITGVTYSSNGTASFIKLNNSTGSTYFGNMIYNLPGTGAIGGVSATNGGNFGYFVSTGSSTGTNDLDATITLPFATATANCVGNFAGRAYNGQFSGHDSNAASSTGFIHAPQTGTITGGTIRVYGITNS
jgi:hypothetical protein